MEFYLINGGPRKKYNTTKLLNRVYDGIKNELEKNNIQEYNINTVRLYDLDYKGCKSCFHCKKIGGKYYGQCPIKDDLRELLPKIHESDAVVFASPIYFGGITGELKSFLERLMFSKLVYGKESLASKKPNGIIYSMNVKKELSDEIYEETVFKTTEEYLSYTFGKPYSLKVYDTYQFKDYSLYENYLFDEKEKAKTLEKQFPKDLDSAYNLGMKLAKDTI
ncbi:NAD(P)H-dependent oxidoreductase [Methanobrevibacter sp.]|uniref:NAD(P)H-dependent oxidoreductase n=1 Tax=Methanobrevibacter sp. TaxID=66852 RepID=UPI003890695C